MSDQPVMSEKPIGELIPDEENANLGTDRGRAALEKSLRDHGAGRSILLDKHGAVIAGNKTLEQAKALGMDEVIVVRTDGTKLIAHQRDDLDLQTDPEARALAYADNRVAELDLNWKVEQLMKDAEKGIDLSLLFYDDELDRMVQGITEDEQKALEAAEAAPDMELQPFEHYDYVMVICRTTFDWTALAEVLGIEKRSVVINQEATKRKIGLCRVVDASKVLKLVGG